MKMEFIEVNLLHKQWLICFNVHLDITGTSFSALSSHFDDVLRGKTGKNVKKIGFFCFLLLGQCLVPGR